MIQSAMRRTRNLECAVRLMLKFLQFLISIYLIFSLYNIGPHWILLIVCLLVPSYDLGAYYMIKSPSKALQHPLPYVRYKALIRNKSWLRVDCTICVTMCFVCLGFSIILFFGYLKAAMASLLLSILYLLNALITAKQIQTALLDMYIDYIDQKPLDTKSSQRSPLAISPCFNTDSSKPNSNEEGQLDKKQSLQLDLDSNTSHRFHKLSTDTETHTTVGSNFPQRFNAWANRFSMTPEKRSVASVAPTELFSSRKTSEAWTSRTSSPPPPLSIHLMEQSLAGSLFASSKNAKEDFANKTANENIVKQTVLKNSNANDDDSMNVIANNRISLPILSSPISFPVYKITTQPYNRRVMQPLNNNIMASKTNAISKESTDEQYLPPFIGLHSQKKISSSSAAYNHEHCTQDRKIEMMNHTSTLPTNFEQIPPLNGSEKQKQTTIKADFIKDSSPKTSAFHSRKYSPNPGTLQYLDYSGVHKAVMAEVVPEPFDFRKNGNKSPSIRRSFDYLGSSGNSTTSDLSGKVKISSSQSTIQLDVLQHPISHNNYKPLSIVPPPQHNTSRSIVNINAEPILAPIATSIDSSRENQIREKKLRNRQNRSSSAEPLDKVGIPNNQGCFRMSPLFIFKKG